ncbi:MAG: heme-binding protein [Pseudomonadota bacterium]
MAHFQTRTALTHEAVLTMLAAAVKKAEEIRAPQCIVIVDASGVPLGEIRMDGSKFVSRKSAMSKALTAASICAPSANVPEPIRAGISSATQNTITFLPGGLPILKDGECLGGIGVGSGTGEQDVTVAKAALEAIDVDPVG